MIQLGLSRVLRLFDPKSITWKAVHVAGTNGKGSVCAYTAALLTQAGWRVGRYTSPHLIDRWDCIQIDGRAIDQAKFQSIEKTLIEKSTRQGICATEFELLTATAFEAFNDAKVDIGVVEVGMGGREDATNILLPEQVSVSVITKIAMDHESLLGDSITEVAGHKAGIIKAGVPCVYDSTNSPLVKAVLEQTRNEVDKAKHGDALHALLQSVSSQQITNVVKSSSSPHDFFSGSQPADHQLMAMSLALSAFEIVSEQTELSRGRMAHISSAQIAQALQPARWPGRLQLVNLESVTGRREEVLLDGAHNPNSAEALDTFVTTYLRKGADTTVTWIYAASAGKDVETMARLLFRKGDTVVTTEFGPVDGMPWVRPDSAGDLLDKISGQEELHDNSQAVSDVGDAVQVGSRLADERPLVIAGSLYLVSDVLRILRSHGVSHT